MERDADEGPPGLWVGQRSAGTLADVEALILMTSLADELDAVIAEAVMGLRVCGYSWAEIGSRLGISRRPHSNAGNPQPSGPAS